jgi:hypothetical protein
MLLGMEDTHEERDTFTSVGALALKVMESVLQRQVAHLIALTGEIQVADRRARTSQAAMAPSRRPIPG